ncbi:MAG: sorbosone dehydrogenase family protein [Alphaproteobacteria bacterium]|nr:sorbosone dehydrogenase family protein [Alphaproteobacteria bacterium]
MRLIRSLALAAVSIPMAVPANPLAQPQTRGGPGIDVPGLRFHLKPEHMPAPYATPSVANSARRAAKPDEAPLDVPRGFRVNLFAGDLDHARWMTVADNGDVLLAEPGPGRITLLRDSDGDGRADLKEAFLRGLVRPHGLAIHDGYLYIGEPSRIVRVPYEPGDLRAGGNTETVGGNRSLGSGGGHWTRNIAFAPDRKTFYVAVGSAGNTNPEDPPRATVQRFDADGGGQSTFATGLRNPVGIAFHPDTDELYVVVNERDGLGDGLVPDYLTRVREGDSFGWPYAYIGPNPDPDFGEDEPGLVARTVAPDVLFQSHSAPLGLVFYDGDMFPESYRGDAFVALHGSWNASRPTGYKVIRVPFRNGRPEGWYENFAVGFWIKGSRTARVWGRPAGLAIAKDGSLLIADDVDQSVWRVSYQR